jgi:hypothetical protein
MSIIVTRGLKKQLKSKTSQQLVREVVQPQEQPCSQAKGIQLIKVPNNEPRQLVMANVPFH